MKKTIFLFFISVLLFNFSFAQKSVLSGTITDENDGEPLIGATVKAANVGVISDFDGKYSLELENGTYELEISYVGYEPMIQSVTLDGDTQMDFQLSSSIVLSEVEVVADIAIERRTPVAFSNVPTKKISEELASQDMPMLLNSTPGVYATETGGGDGDARITIRGFDQRNIAVMLDGVPVNDMENGWVYWSNWFGLDLVTNAMQVQRGLGASKLSIPSVGGTINILTKGIDNKKSIRFRQEVGNNGFLRSTFGINSGRLKNGWGVSLAGSYKQGDGWVDGNFTEGYFYYLRVDKELGNHRISLSGFGAPQNHGQRSFTRQVGFYNTEYAAELFEGNSDLYNTFVDYNQGRISDDEFNSVLAENNIDENRLEELNYNFIDTTGEENNGLRFNEFWGYDNGKLVNTRKNFYHKPQFTLRHSWQINPKTFWSTTTYLSLGNGGGTSDDGAVDFVRDENNQLDFQKAREANLPSAFNPDGLSNVILRANVNNHFWYGAISTVQYTINDNLTFSGGVDGRYYEGEHYREVYDLLGGTGYTINNLQVGDKYEYDYTGFVRWLGGFGLLEYNEGRLSAFANISGAATSYKIHDNFADVGIDWVTKPSLTFKAGANYNLDAQNNIFINAGYLDKVQRFNNVLISNFWDPETPPQEANDYENEKIKAVELGYSFKSQKFSANVNTYYTVWDNKPLDRLPSVALDPSDADSDRIPVNINGIAALHKGIEIDFAFKPMSNLTIEGLASIGDWIWNSSDTARVNLPDRIVEYEFDAKGVHVGDAAQLQFGGMVRYEPFNDFYLKLRTIYFAKNYASFQPETLQGEDGGRDSWQMPNYTLLSFHTGYYFKVKNIGVNVRANVLNLLDTTYISDARNNDTFNSPPGRDFNASSASVHFGQGRRWNLSLQLNF